LRGFAWESSLEFNYPEDERKLKDALNGTQAIDALFKIQKILSEHGKPNDKLKDKQLCSTTLRNFL
jgi:hypothetical protein